MAADATFSIGGQNYSMGKMSPQEQLHIVKRISRVVGALGNKELLAQAMEGAKTNSLAPEEAVGIAAALIKPLGEALADMPDADFDFVVNKCLSVIQRSQMDGKMWAPVMANGVVMFGDIDAVVMLEMTVKVIMYNLSNFIQTSLGDLGQRLGFLQKVGTNDSQA